MNKTLQSTFDEIKKLPNKQQDHIASAIADLLDQANLGVLFDQRFATDPAYSSYVKSALDAGEHDVDTGNTKDMDEVFDEIELQLKSRHGAL